MATRVVDSDAHVIEGQELMAELLARFPDKIRMARPDEEGAALVIEGRRYPNASGPGAGCHAKHGLCLDRGASPFTAEGVMRDADREGIDAMVFFPSAALGLPAFTDLAFAAEFARLYNRWLAGYCRQFPGACSASVWCRSRTWRPPSASCARPGSSAWSPSWSPPSSGRATWTIATWSPSTPPPRTWRCRSASTARPASISPRSAPSASTTTSRCTS